MNIRDPGVNQTIPDVQSSADTRRLAIDKVGIKAIRHPIKVGEKGGGGRRPDAGGGQPGSDPQ